MVVDYVFRGYVAPPDLPGTPLENSTLPDASTNLFEAVAMEGQDGYAGALEIYWCATVSGILKVYRKTSNDVETLEALNSGNSISANTKYGPDVVIFHAGDEISLQFTGTGGTCYLSVADVSGDKIQKVRA